MYLQPPRPQMVDAVVYYYGTRNRPIRQSVETRDGYFLTLASDT
jgi:hypothetical protein